MGVRVKLKIKGRRASVITAALVNSGFETEDPELIIPESLAERIGITGSSIAQYKLAGSSGVMGLRVEELIDVELLLDDKQPIRAKAVVTIIPGEEEVIISDYLASNLGIVILNPHKGEWCLIEEIGRKVRFSEEPEFWR